MLNTCTVLVVTLPSLLVETILKYSQYGVCCTHLRQGVLTYFSNFKQNLKPIITDLGAITK